MSDSLGRPGMVPMFDWDVRVKREVVVHVKAFDSMDALTRAVAEFSKERPFGEVVATLLFPEQEAVS